MSRLDFCKYELVDDCYDWKNDNCDKCNIFKAYCEGEIRAKNSIVRCKDCRHRCKEPIYSNADVHWVIYQIGDCPIICKTVRDDDFCSYGERREE